jgi:signal transduction histidine kinase
VGIGYLILIAYRLRNNPDPRAQRLWLAALVILMGIALLFARPLSQQVEDKTLGLLLTLPYNSIALGIAALLLGEAVLRYQLFDPLQQLNQQLTQTNHDLGQALRAKDQFLANMSHELRTPLNAIIGYITLVHDGHYGPVTEKQQERLHRAERNAQHLLQLINMVLDLSKIRAGEFELYTKPVEAQALLQQTVETLAPLAEAKRLTLSYEAPLPVTFQADPERLKQVLINLTSNAIKFTEQGSVRLRAYQQDGQVCLAIQDSGIGIAPEQQVHIFEEFKQADESSTRQYQGTGLGLAISKRLVELHGGTIHLDSTLGQGSTFTVKLPLKTPS